MTQTTVRPQVPLAPLSGTVHLFGDVRLVSLRIGDTYSVADQSDLQS